MVFFCEPTQPLTTIALSFGQASSEHPLGKAMVEYARHFHFFDEPSATKNVENQSKESSGWLFDVTDFSALPGQGIQCIIEGKRILVRVHFISLRKYER